jgi:S1-C subfamily serine protease
MKAIGIKYYKKRLNPNNIPTMGLNIEPDGSGKVKIASLSSDYKGFMLKPGDIITHINDKELKISAFLEIMNTIKKMNVEDEYQLDIIRNGSPVKITEKLYAKHDEHVFELDQNAPRKAKELREIVMAKYD